MMQSIGIYGSTGAWKYGCMEVWVHGSMGAWKYGCMEVWVHGSMGAWKYGCMEGSTGAWKYGFMEVWVHGSMGEMQVWEHTQGSLRYHGQEDLHNDEHPDHLMNTQTTYIMMNTQTSGRLQSPTPYCREKQ